jgi:acetyl-CoA C-acetyltransferase
MIAARRTAVVPRGGAFAHVEADELADAVIRHLLQDVSMPVDAVDEVILGNALYGGGNPARVAALRAELPASTPAMTIDTQCCSGLDAIILAASRIEAGHAHVIVAGGVESFSRAPIRQRRPKEPGELPRAYDRPPFTPWPERDPDLLAAASALAKELGHTRTTQERFAVESHAKAMSARMPQDEIVVVEGQKRDAFARRLNPQLCRRLPVLSGDDVHGCTAATVAVEADAAAAVLLVSADVIEKRHSFADRAVKILGGTVRGGDPEQPALAPIGATKRLLDRHAVRAYDLGPAEVMEAFAVQALACIQGIGLDDGRVNRGGGALARGHPIGASGAILAVRLWHELQGESRGTTGLATIAAAGGLGSALLMER